MSNKFFILSLSCIFLFFLSCKKNKEENVSSKENSLEKNINRIMDSMAVNLPKEYPINLYTISHQKKYGKDYIKISTSEFFNSDSVSTIEMRNKKLIVYYSKGFFKQKKEDNLSSYKEFEYTDKTISLYHPRYIIFEILKNNTYKNIPLEKSIEMKLFNYGDRYIPEPTPLKK